MTYNDYRTHLLTCEYLGREPTGQYKKVRDFLTDLWDGMECIVNEDNGMINLHKGGEWIFALDMEINVVWCNDQTMFFFTKGMGMEFPEIRDFIESLMVEHLCCEVGMTYWI